VRAVVRAIAQNAGKHRMSGCRIKQNLAPRGATKTEDKAAQAAMAAKLALMIAERERQDKAFSNVALTDKEYEQQYGKQPGSEK